MTSVTVMDSLMLKNLNVLVTRPQPHSEDLCHLIANKGGKAFALPLVRIEPINLHSHETLTINNYDKIIFVSRPAAELGADWATGKSVSVYAVGAGTAKVLESKGIYSNMGKTPDSEGLLDLIALQQIDGQRILIIRGKGGRKLLKQTLTSRGGCVDELALYQRLCINYSKGHINKLVESQQINVIVTTSAGILNNLLQQVDLALLKKVTLVVPSERILSIAKEQGFFRVVCATGADNDAILRSLITL